MTATAKRRDAASSSLRGNLNRWFSLWIKRRGPVKPPLKLGYRQIFILPTRFGWLLGLLMFGMLMGSLNFNNNLGLLTTFIVAGLAINSMLLAYRNLRGLGILHCQAAPVFAGQAARLEVSLAGEEGLARPGLELRGFGKVTRFDLPGNGRVEAAIDVPTQVRGWLDPGRLRVQTSHPIGLFESWSWFWPEKAILVWPQPASQAPPLPRGSGSETGQQLQREPEGESFYSLRRWRSGDPLHRIAWKASQRHQTLLSREFRAEHADHLRLDLNQTPGQDLEERISVMTAWVLQAEREDLHWTLSLGQQQLGPDHGPGHAHRCLRALAEL
jgi:uncharacterized protein (DUF58 family)